MYDKSAEDLSHIFGIDTLILFARTVTQIRVQFRVTACKNKKKYNKYIVTHKAYGEFSFHIFYFSK